MATLTRGTSPLRLKDTMKQLPLISVLFSTLVAGCVAAVDPAPDYAQPEPEPIPEPIPEPEPEPTATGVKATPWMFIEGTAPDLDATIMVNGVEVPFDPDTGKFRVRVFPDPEHPERVVAVVTDKFGKQTTETFLTGLPIVVTDESGN
jgi:hypothetical protein